MAKYEGKNCVLVQIHSNWLKESIFWIKQPYYLVACKFYYAYDYILMYYVLDIFYWNVTLFSFSLFPSCPLSSQSDCAPQSFS